MGPEDILSEDGSLIARIITAEQLWSGIALNFWTADQDYIQVGTWTHPEGTVLPPHIHNVFSRESFRTQEAVYVVSGSLLVRLYDESETFITERQINCGDVLICFSGGHGYTIQEEGSRILEIKNGPYFGPDVDRRRL